MYNYVISNPVGCAHKPTTKHAVPPPAPPERHNRSAAAAVTLRSQPPLSPYPHLQTTTTVWRAACKTPPLPRVAREWVGTGRDSASPCPLQGNRTERTGTSRTSLPAQSAPSRTASVEWFFFRIFKKLIKTLNAHSWLLLIIFLFNYFIIQWNYNYKLISYFSFYVFSFFF